MLIRVGTRYTTGVTRPRRTLGRRGTPGERYTHHEYMFCPRCSTSATFRNAFRRSYQWIVGLILPRHATPLRSTQVPTGISTPRSPSPEVDTAQDRTTCKKQTETLRRTLGESAVIHHASTQVLTVKLPESNTNAGQYHTQWSCHSTRHYPRPTA